MAFGALIVHWVLIVGWGLAMNNQGGYLYCRLAVPNPDLSWFGITLHPVPWIFTITGCAVLALLGIADRRLLHLSSRRAFYPLMLFPLTQAVLAWVNLFTTRF